MHYVASESTVIINQKPASCIASQVFASGRCDFRDSKKPIDRTMSLKRAPKRGG
jgi:hypothetical protein